MVIGIIQSIYVVNYLSQADYGSVQVVLGIASIVGASQAFGLTSGSTREISGAKNKTEAKKIFTTAFVIRLLISVPFALFLLLFASRLSAESSNPAMFALAVKIMGVALLIESVQSVFTSLLSAYQKFSTLFTFQVFIALVSLPLYIFFITYYGFIGYFYAYLTHNLVWSLIIAFLALRVFDFKILIPNKKEALSIFNSIFSISLSIYVVKLLFTLWKDSPKLYMNYVLDINEVVISVYAFAFLYASKLLIFSDSITDVTLPVMSKEYFKNSNDFIKVYKSNFNKTMLIITFAASVASFWNRDIIMLVIKPEYLPSTSIIPLIMFGVLSYSAINLLKSSVFVPAKKLKLLISSYASMLIFVYVCIFVLIKFGFGALNSVSIGFGFGTFLALLYTLFLIRYFFKANFVYFLTVVFFVISSVYSLMFYVYTDATVKFQISFLYFLVFMIFAVKFGITDILKRKIKK